MNLNEETEKCSVCGRKAHRLAKLNAGLHYCWGCFDLRIANCGINSPNLTLVKDTLVAATELLSASQQMARHDTDRGRREIGHDLMDTLEDEIPCLEREYYTLALESLPEDYRPGRWCRWCHRPWTKDEEAWLYWDLCRREDCGARDAGIPFVGE